MCLSYLRDETKINLFVHLYRLEKDFQTWQFFKLLHKTEFPPSFICFFVLQVPQVLGQTAAFINLNIHGGNTSMSEKTSLLIKPPASIHIVQTDKPIYKPGQTGGC